MARRVRKQARRGGGPPAWLWLIGGLLIGFGLFAVLFLRDVFDEGERTPRARPGTQPPAPAVEEPLAQEQPARRPRYDFYTLLPEREVEIPDEELRASARAERERPAAAPTPTLPDGVRFLLQAGSFADPKRAEEHKARIAFAGELARVEATEVDGGTRYRVMLGPYGDARSLEAAKGKLSQAGIESIAVRAR